MPLQANRKQSIRQSDINPSDGRFRTCFYAKLFEKVGYKWSNHLWSLCPEWKFCEINGNVSYEKLDKDGDPNTITLNYSHHPRGRGRGAVDRINEIKTEAMGLKERVVMKTLSGTRKIWVKIDDDAKGDLHDYTIKVKYPPKLYSLLSPPGTGLWKEVFRPSQRSFSLDHSCEFVFIPWWGNSP